MLATLGVDPVVGTIRTGADQVVPVADPLVARPAIGDPAPGREVELQTRRPGGKRRVGRDGNV